MNTRTLMSVVAASLLSFPSASEEAPENVTAMDLINIFEKMSGTHPGFRKAHAKGICATATFTPHQSKHFDNAPLLTSGDLPVSMRFSLGGGNPQADERIPGTRGVGIQIKTPDGRQHVFTGNNFPVFLGKDPATFYGMLQTLLPDENGNRDMQKTLNYVKSHPSVQAHAAWQQTAQTPASFGLTQFFGLHTFYYDATPSSVTKFRWELIPDGGVKTYTKEQASALPDAFLEDALNKQVSEGPVSFTLVANIGLPEDSDNDPSQQWPEERPEVTLGQITLQSVGGASCKNTNFDPNLLSAGFRPSEDPVLQMRSAAYAISFGKRLSNQ